MQLREINSEWNAQLARIRECGDAVLIEAVRLGKISVHSAALVAVLDTVGGYVTGDVASKVLPTRDRNKRQHSMAVRAILLDLERHGWVRRLDDEKPVCWVGVSH